MEWEEVEEILSWGEMQPGVYKVHGIKYCGRSSYGVQMFVLTLEREGF